MNYKMKFILLLIAVPCIFVIQFVVFLIVAFAADPLQIFGKGVFYSEKYDEDMRLQARGIIDNVGFDGAILGTSMLENSSAREAGRLLGGAFVNVSMSGSNFYERYFVLDYLVKNRDIKQVIYSFDLFAYKDASMSVAEEDRKWTVLYDDTVWNDFFVYVDRKYIVKSAKFLFSDDNMQTADMDYFDRPHAWFLGKGHASRFGGLENWVANKSQQGVGEFLYETLPNTISRMRPSPIDVRHDEKREIKSCDYIDFYFLSVVRDNPNTTFYIIFPPYYRYVYAEMHQVNGDDFGLHQRVITHMVNATEQYPNLEVYGFEDVEFLNDIANYKDTGHYAVWVNSFFSESIATKRHRLTPSNLDAYLKKCATLAATFDIRQLYQDALDVARRQEQSP